MSILSWLFGPKRSEKTFKQVKGIKPTARLTIADLTQRTCLSEMELKNLIPNYREFSVPKRSGERRIISEPEPQLKQIQRVLLRRLLISLKAHPAAKGFEEFESIASNALPHVGKAVVVKLDIRDFFDSIDAKKVYKYFMAIGWDKPTAELLTRLCTWKGSLPQGAPTSPRLSNLLLYKIDTRLTAYAQRYNFTYTRYADDLTFSLPEDRPGTIRKLIKYAERILSDEGLSLHTDRKLRILRHSDRQLVTGLVVNEKPQLPRSKRRWLRAVRHRMTTGGNPTITPESLKGWEALESMIKNQTLRGE